MPLLHDVLNAYLSPLLKKHSIAGGFLTYEDLEASMELAKAVLVETPNEFVLVRTFDCFVDFVWSTCSLLLMGIPWMTSAYPRSNLFSFI